MLYNQFLLIFPPGLCFSNLTQASPSVKFYNSSLISSSECLRNYKIKEVDFILLNSQSSF